MVRLGSNGCRNSAGTEKLRSERWLANNDFRAFNHHSRIMQMGYDRKDWEGKPLIAILNSWSDFNPCHMHFRRPVAFPSKRRRSRSTT